MVSGQKHHDVRLEIKGVSGQKHHVQAVGCRLLPVRQSGIGDPGRRGLQDAPSVRTAILDNDAAERLQRPQPGVCPAPLVMARLAVLAVARMAVKQAASVIAMQDRNAVRLGVSFLAADDGLRVAPVALRGGAGPP